MRNLPHNSATARAELGDRFDWNHLAANVAHLVDLMSYQVHADYVQAITDPEDPQIRAEQERRNRQGIKPPPVPLVPPVAIRPESVAAEYEDAYRDMVARFAPADGAPAGSPGAASTGPTPDQAWVTDTEQIDQILTMR